MQGAVPLSSVVLLDVRLLEELFLRVELVLEERPSKRLLDLSLTGARMLPTGNRGMCPDADGSYGNDEPFA